MANFFSLQDGNLTDALVYGYSLSTAEAMYNTSGVYLSTADAYGPVFTGDGSAISAIAVHLSSRQANNTTDNLVLKLSVAGGAGVVRTETYPISLFTQYDGSNNFIANYPLNWQILKLSTPYTLSNLSSAKISLAATTNNVISLIGGTSNNFDKTIISNVNILTGAFLLSGSPTLSSASPFGVGTDASLLFNGTNSFITISGSSSLNFGTNNFTIECWINLANYSSGDNQGRCIFSQAWKTVSTDGPKSITLGVNNSGKLYFGASSNTTSLDILNSTGNTTLSTNVWYHVAFVRYGNSFFAYLNGNQEINGTSSAAIGFPNNSITIGACNNLNTYYGYFSGCISNYRIVIGHSLYINNFTPPTSPLPIPVNTYLILKNPYYSLSSYQYTSPIAFTNLNDIHIGGAIKSSTIETRNITADTYSTSNLYIHNQGNLSFPLTSNKTLNLYGISGLQVTSNGTLNIGTNTQYIPLTTTHTLINNFSIIHIHNGGNLNVYGYPKLGTTYLTTDSISGLKTFTTTDSVSTSWLSGDSLVYTPNLTYKTGFDTLTLSSFVASNTFTTTTSSYYTHLAQSTLPSIPAICNLTRNVILSAPIYAELSANININNAIVNNNLYYPVIPFYLNNNVLYNQSLYFNLTSLGNFNATYFTSIFSISTPSNSTYTQEFWLSASNFFPFNTNFSGDNANLFRMYFGDGYVSIQSLNSSTDSGGTFYSTAVKRNTWFHFAMVVTPTNVHKIYINGKLIGSATTSRAMGGKFNTNDGGNGGGGVFNIYNLRLVDGEAIYNSSFVPSYNYPLPKIGTVKQQDFLYGGPNNYNLFNKNSYNSINFTNNIFFNNTNMTFDSVLINNLNFTNNILLSSINQSLSVTNITCYNCQSYNNVSIYSPSYGGYFYNNSLTGSYGILGYNSTLQGVMLTGYNTGLFINGGGVNSSREGVYVDASSNSLNGLSFQNILANNNTSTGFKISGNNINAANAYLNPLILNINGLTASRNSNYGIEAYNIVGNISSVNSTNNNNFCNINTSIGNGPTIFDGLTSTFTKTPYIPSLFTSYWVEDFYSGFFDNVIGTGNSTNYISFPTVTLTTTTYTVDFWMNSKYSAYNDTASTTGVVFGGSGLNGTILQFRIRKPNQLQLDSGSNNYVCTTPFTLVDDTWYHVAVVNNAASFTIYINGTACTKTSTGTVLDGATNLTISYIAYGYTTGNAGNPYTIYRGYISNFRITPGTAIWTTGFTPPNINSYKVAGTALLTLRDQFLTDYSNNIYTVTPVGTVPVSFDSSIYKFKLLQTGSIVSGTTARSVIMNILTAFNYDTTIIKNAILSSSPLLVAVSATSALCLSSVGKLEDFRLENSILSSSVPFTILNSRSLLEGSYTFHNCNSNVYNLSTIATSIYQSDVFGETGFSVMRESGLSGNHYRLLDAGKVELDPTIAYNTKGFPSEKLTPMDSNTKLRSGSKIIPLNAGDRLTISVYVKKATSYIGAPPRLMLRSNSTMGYSDTVLATSVAANNTWENLTGSIPTALADGMIEVYIDCSGSIGSGSINIDSWGIQ